MSTSFSPDIPHLPACLAENKVASLPPDVYYIPDFITEEEETMILQKVLARLLSIMSRCIADDFIRSKTHPNPDGNSSPIGGSRHGLPTL